MVELKNIFIIDSKTSLGYSNPKGRGGANYPVRNDGNAHALFIQRQLKNSYSRSIKQKQAAAIRYKNGTYLEFTSAKGHDLALQSLEDNRQGIRLTNVREIWNPADDSLEEKNKIIRATVYVPNGKENVFLKKASDFFEERTNKGNPKNFDFITSIEDIRLAVLDSFWFGDFEDMPEKDPKWCEVWLRYQASKKEDETKESEYLANIEFERSCRELEIPIDKKMINFPERIVRLIYANKKQLDSLVESSDYIAEFRRAPENLSFFEELSGTDQKDWIDELNERVQFTDGNATVCLLDSGLMSEHPLIKNAIIDKQMIQAVDSEWGPEDNIGHGTQMAGIAIYNDLKEKLISEEELKIRHKIESVKILPPTGENRPDLYGSITENAVFLSEIENPNAERAICMAVTSPEYNTDDGSPTSWSATIDNITSGANESDNKRLFFVSAGNVYSPELENLNYPEANILHKVENPGQSWNAITVGAYSNDISLESDIYRDFEPVADVGELSPYSSTSITWDSKWPVKPEILMDGGNMITNGSDVSDCEELELLTTNKDFNIKPLTTLAGTSSATAQASWMAAQIYSEYPNIWPETVRALMIHSASWTDKMLSQFKIDDRKTSGKKQLLRTCGYGIPDLSKAIECKNNSVNLVIESEIQPFNKKKMNEMHIHELPWPNEVLQELGEIGATLKVTLSYFIEPGPGEIGWKNKYRYPSAGLRFDVMNSNENLEEFQQRINHKMRDENTVVDTSSVEWYLGTSNRDVGSIHSDFFETTAVELSDTNFVAVYPVIGWWRERPYLGRFNNRLRYSLIISIETPELEADLYTSIVSKIAITQSI